MPRCPRCPDVWAKRKHPGRPDTKPDGLHPGCLDIWASGLLPSLHPGIRLLASSGQGQTSGSSWRAWTPARIQVHLGEPRRGLNGPIRASGLAWFVWPETPGCTVMAESDDPPHTECSRITPCPLPFLHSGFTLLARIGVIRLFI